MNEDDLKKALFIARAIKTAIAPVQRPQSAITAPTDQPVLPHSLFQDSRGYIQKVVFQINRTYSSTCYDACAVMVRRLIEMLIIEAFERENISHKIKNGDGDYFFLDDLIRVALGETSWTLGRTTKSTLRKLKTIGDQSAHSRRYNAHREYIDDIIIDLRGISAEFLYLAGMKK